MTPRSGHHPGLQGFLPETFAQRRARVREALGAHGMLIPAAPRVYRSGDSELPYRPDSELFYLTGWWEPDALLFLRGGDNPTEILFVAPRDPEVERWLGAQLGPEEAQAVLGVGTVRSMADLDTSLVSVLELVSVLHFRLHGAGPLHARVGRMVQEALARGRSRGARTGGGLMGVMDPGGILDELRLRKDPDEVEALRGAAAASVAGFEGVLNRLRDGVRGSSAPVTAERQLEGELLRAFREAGGLGPSFSPIVAGGARACTLHYTDNQGALAQGDLVLVDAGAEVRRYAGDISRTLPVGGRFSSEQRDLYQVVETARAQAVSVIAPGVPVSRIHEVATLTLVEGLIALGHLQGDPIALVEARAHTPFFPHQTSHWLGLDTHDPGAYKVGQDSRLLEPGMVLTVEPGLYLEGKMGIRIEDDILVTPEGYENLTAALPSDLDALEARLQ